MSAIYFEERDLRASVPRAAGVDGWGSTSLLWRRDPLTGVGVRILTGVKLQPSERPDLTELVAPPAFCPFDAVHLEESTFVFPPELAEEGRIRRGRAVVVPNILAYSTHSGVGIYDTERHFLDLEDFTPSLIADGLGAMVEHARAVRRWDPTAVWSSISANHLPPAGASLVHPHLQSAHDAFGLTAQRVLVKNSMDWARAHGDSYWSSLVESEIGGERWIGRIGRVSWLTPFAPIGFHEVWGIVEGVNDLPDLGDGDFQSLGYGMSRVLGAYRDWNLTSFNFALMGGGPVSDAGQYCVILKMVSRSNAEPWYRSDCTYFEKLHGEALIDVSPEVVASRLRTLFNRLG